MPFLELSFSTGSPGEALIVGFGQWKAMVMDWRRPFQEMAREYAEYEERVFASEGREGLGPWRKLSPQYAAWKEKNFPGQPILTRTGRLRAAAQTVVLLTADRLVMGPGNRVPYAAYHNRPAELGGRPFVRPSPREIRRLTEIARRHIISARRAMKAALVEARGRGLTGEGIGFGPSPAPGGSGEGVGRGGTSAGGPPSGEGVGA